MLSKIKSLRTHEGFQKYFKNTSWLFAEKIFRIFTGLFVGIWVARFLGPEQFGIFSYAQSFVGLFSTIATLGIDGILIRELLKKESDRDVLIGTSFFLKIIGAICVIVIISIALFFTSNDLYTNTLVLIIASSTIFQSFNVVDLYFQSKVLSRYVVYANVISLIFSSFLKILFIMLEAPLEAFVWVVLFDSIILAIGFIYFYIRQTPNFSFRNYKFKYKTAYSLLKDSWPLILSGIVVSIYMKIDQVMIKEILDAEAVGQYAAAVKLSEAFFFIPAVISGSVFPAIMSAKNQSNTLYINRLQQLFFILTWTAIIIAIFTAFLSHHFIEILYGEKYNLSGDVLMIHIWTGIFVFIGVAGSKWYIAENLQIYSFVRTFIGMVVNIVLNFILIPEYGIQGAALATLIGQIFASYFSDSFSKKTMIIFKLKTKSVFFWNFRHYLKL